MIQTADQIIQLGPKFIETIFLSPVSFEPQKSPDSFTINRQGFLFFNLYSSVLCKSNSIIWFQVPVHVLHHFYFCILALHHLLHHFSKKLHHFAISYDTFPIIPCRSDPLQIKTFRTLPSPTSRHTPEKYRTSDNTNPRLPTKSDDPVPESGTPPAAASYVHSAQPGRSFW